MVALIIALFEHEENIEPVKTCLGNVGHEVLFVDSFPKAKIVLQAQPCDLIISDVHLENGGSVFDFLQWVKANSLLKPIPFVLLSVQPSEYAKYLRDGVMMAARHLGAAKYICMEKFDAAVFMSELAEFLPQSGSAKQPLIVHKLGE